MLSWWVEEDPAHCEWRRVSAGFDGCDGGYGGAPPNDDNDGGVNRVAWERGGVQGAPDCCLCVCTVGGSLPEVAARRPHPNCVHPRHLWSVHPGFELHHDAAPGVALLQNGVDERPNTGSGAPHADLGLHDGQACGVKGVLHGARVPVPLSEPRVAGRVQSLLQVRELVVDTAPDVECRRAPSCGNCPHCSEPRRGHV